jgi:TRAP-type C4-dicarboxylate transport system permease small subunit
VAAGTELRQPNFFRTYLLYLAAGAGGIPAALVYATLAGKAIVRPGVTVLVLAAGLLLAHLGWQFAERWLLGIPKGSETIPIPKLEFRFPTVKQDFMTAGVAIASWLGVLLIGFFLAQFLFHKNPIQL